MNFKKLLIEDRAVSPVIGVILMVAITVILAAVIGTFVLGLGDQVSESAPQAQFTFDFPDASNATISHDGGDSIEDSTLSVSIGGTTAYNGSDGIIAPYDSGPNSNDGWSSEVSAGSTLKLDADGADQSGEDVRIIWSSSNSDKTATIGKSTWQG